MAEKRDYYEVLGVDKSADEQTLKKVGAQYIAHTPDELVKILFELGGIKE